MSIGPLSPLISAAGAPLAQSKGAEIDVSLHVSAAHQRHVSIAASSDSAASVAPLDGDDHFAEERSADGRQPWQRPIVSEDESIVPPPCPTIPPLDPAESSGLRIDVTV